MTGNRTVAGLEAQTLRENHVLLSAARPPRLLVSSRLVSHVPVPVPVPVPALSSHQLDRKLGRPVAHVDFDARGAAPARTELDRERLRRLAIGAVAALVLIVLAIPSSLLSYGRPLART
ncbi:MAG: hypothetical protein KF764_26840 [Labilithrix sp.]|nr:hypothetical protein [Labilithrix sp.]